MKRTVYVEIASALDAMRRCNRDHEKPGFNHLYEWIKRHEDRAVTLTREYMPSGSGFDNGTHIYLRECQNDKLVFMVSFHHMDENGYYDGWTEHKIVVTPSLVHGLNIRITGPNRNDIKEYLAEAFRDALTSTFEQ